MTPALAHALYALAWLAFGLGHSLLAGRVWLGRWSRLAYNGIAVASFAGVSAVGAVTLAGQPMFDLPAPVLAGLAAIHFGGWAVLLLSARHYDLGRLGGLTQLRHPDRPSDEELRLDGPHRWVRHPLYAGAFLILWGAAVNPLGLATACWGSLYLLAGTWCEERRLIRLYGRAYSDYRARVPAFAPWRGRVTDPGRRD
ncbi:isoprenylcysteine carboxylmethyltransferase family protein [Magnetospirillum sp. SS-4]|uniref:methyltransferase family protein n=1 Tax=Magnetospirillum sp. SS-4 TaxID=2681465 RepID=UPI001385C70F|nr:isoprenylcysteine carboxylmethyltransferase family protein [Magnetospirillum sp. SS-4]CAA7614362.1 conserved membrane hypothetical protein [Magnetospirillum sp. SS-4]